MSKIIDNGVANSFRPFYRVTPIWENNLGEQFSYGEEVFTERTLEEVEEACARIENREYFRVELVSEVRILEPAQEENN